MKHYKSIFIFVAAVVILFSLIYSVWLHWVGDDIFIGLRYVQNFIAGNGLVYNVGERVEGYTDFLWIMIISLFTWLKADQVFIVQFLGILSSLGTLILFSIITYKMTYPRNNFVLPFIIIALAVNYDYNVWATGGLECSFFTFLLTAAFYFYFFSSIKVNHRKIYSGLFVCLALLTRPDAILILAMSNVIFIVNNLKKNVGVKYIISDLLLFNLFTIIIYIPYFIWRFQYYGFLFPNTYYDKMGYTTAFGKGFFYIWLYLKIHFVSIFAIILPSILLIPYFKKKSAQGKVVQEDSMQGAFITSILFVYAYLLLFVAKVGGDFMFARFIIPVVPFIYFIIYYSLLKLINVKYQNVVFVVLLCVCLYETTLRFQIFQGKDENGNPQIATYNQISDERDVYTNYYPIENEIKFGKLIRSAFGNIDGKVLILGSQACFGYYSDFSYCQEYHGLTDTTIAHSKIENRGRIGHEKSGTLEYFESKGINFLFKRTLPTADNFRQAAILIDYFQVQMFLVSYNAELMNKLKEHFKDKIEFVNFQSYLDDYIINQMPNKSVDDLKKDYDNFYLYYFRQNEDKVREIKFLNLIENRD